MFRGAYVAIVTPFKRDGRVDKKALAKLVRWQIEQGTDGILCLGATGEGIALSDREKLQVAGVCVEAANGQIPILAGSGSAGTDSTVKLTEKMGRLGVSGCLVVTPYYNRPSGKGCLAHYREVAKVGVPIVPYYNPKRTQTVFSPEIFAEIGNLEGVAALKDSSGEIEFTKRVRQLTQTPILSGDDDCTFETLRIGGAGAISVIGNAFPKQWKEMIKWALEGEWEKAKRRYDRYFPLCKALFIESNPQCIKWLCHWMGLSSCFMRLPLMEPEESTRQKIKEVVLKMALPQFFAALKKV